MKIVISAVLFALLISACGNQSSQPEPVDETASLATPVDNEDSNTELPAVALSTESVREPEPNPDLVPNPEPYLVPEFDVTAESTAELELYTNQSQLELHEGDPTALSLSVIARRTGSSTDTIEFSLLGASPTTLDNINYWFEERVQTDNEIKTLLHLQLSITMAPIQSHVRQITLVATSGGLREEIPLQLDIKPVAAPDVYLLIGQSNMEGYSEIGAKDAGPGGLDEKNQRIWQLNVQPNNAILFTQAEHFKSEANNTLSPMFVLAEDPLHEPRHTIVPSKGGTHIGLGLTFAKDALIRTTQHVYLVPAAWGGTGFCKTAMSDRGWNADPTEEPWLGGSNLTDRALTRLNVTLQETGGILRGILWLQGESDSNNVECANSYASNLKKMVERIRRDARIDLRGVSARGIDAAIPMVAGTMSRGNDQRGAYSVFGWMKDTVDQAHRRISELIPYADYSNHDDLVPPSYPCGQTSCVHFGAAAYREQGHRFYDALAGIWDRRYTAEEVFEE